MPVTDQPSPQNNGDGEINNVSLIFHGVNLGTIVEIGTVGDFYPDGATNVPIVESGELSTGLDENGYNISGDFLCIISNNYF